MILLVVIYAVVVLRRAWVCDDAYITFRTIDNLVNGYRLTWNVGERVQAYTHPLWMLVMSVFYYMTREIYLTSIAVSLAVAVAGVVVYVVGVARGRYQAALGVLILSLSNAYVDYSTSGLENALSHLLLVVYVALYVRMGAGVKKVLWMSVVASLGIVNRMDMGLLYAPLLALVWWESGERLKGLAAGVLGQMPFVLWEVFSLVYYGFPFPNTAYAKLNTALPAWDLIRQGSFYYLDSLERDPLTLLVVFLAVILAFVKRDRAAIAVSVGILCYLGYILKIGGDFMSGRFFTAPLVMAMMLLSFREIKQISNRWQAFAIAVVLAVGLTSPMPTFRLELPEGLPVSSQNGVTDERAWYFKDAGLFGAGDIRRQPDVLGREAGLEARRKSVTDLFITPANHIGVFGYYAGQNVYVIDQYALADPLLARLPPAREVGWYIGHFKRVIPDGYVSSIYTGEARLTDQKLAAYYSKLLLITRGKLTDPLRWEAIWEMNTGKLNYLIDFDRYRYPNMLFLKLSDVPRAADDASQIVIGDSGVEIDLERTYYAHHIQAAFDKNDDYQIVYYHLGKEIARQTIRADDKGEEAAKSFAVPQRAVEQGYDRLRIFPVRGDSFYALKGLSLRDEES